MNSEKKVEKNIALNFEEIITYDDVKPDSLPETLEELNAYLQDKVQHLISENGYLRQALDEEIDKLEKMKNKLIEYKNIELNETTGLTNFQNMKTPLLLEPINREQEEVVVLKHEKLITSGTSAVKSEEKVTCEKSTLCKRDKDCCDCPEQLKEKSEKLKLLSEKLQQTNAKLYETKNYCIQLKQEINKAQKLLCKEVGENVTITGLTNGVGGWRGRAEQIQQLQQKIIELQNRFNESEALSKNISTSFDNRSLSNFKCLEKERKQQIENLSKKLKDCEADLENYKKRIDAAKIKIKALENEVNTLKRNIKLLNEKTQHDDQLIEALHEELKTLNKKYHDCEKEKEQIEDKIKHECIILQNELQTVQIQREQYKMKLEEREKEINILRSNDVYTKNEFSCLPANMSNTEFSTTSNMQIMNDYFVIAGVAAEAEKDRLMELITVLNQRLNQERNTNDQLSQKLKEEHKKSAKLDIKLQKLELENINLSKFTTGYCKSRLVKQNARNRPETTDNLTVDEAQLKIELLEEECLALRTKLATVQFEKQSDLAIYKRMLNQTRLIFQDAARFEIILIERLTDSFHIPNKRLFAHTFCISGTQSEKCGMNFKKIILLNSSDIHYYYRICKKKILFAE